jgi:Bacterial membrane protein YfhO
MQRDVAEQPTAGRTPEPIAAEDGGPAREHPPSRRALAIEGLVVYLVLQLLTIPFLDALRTSSQSFYNDVLIGFFGPEKHGLARLLRAGVLPVWLDNQYGGEPFMANLQHAVLYPGNLPFWVLPTATALELVCAVHVALAGFGMWAYCRLGLRTSRWGAALAGLAFGLGSVTLAHIILMNQLQVIAWMPLVLLFGHLALERGRLRFVVLTGVAVGLQLLAGHPEEWVYTLVALATYGLAWTLAAAPRSWPRRGALAALRLGGAMVVFGLLFAWQLLPTLLLQRQGWRTAPTFEEQYELPKQLAFNALLPDYGHVLTGENQAFIGLVALALAGLGIWAGPLRLAWARVWMLLLAVLGMVMALGDQNPFYRFVAERVDVVQEFRVPARYLLLFYFTMAAAAALGTDVLLYDHLGRVRRRLLQGLGGLAVLGLLFVAALTLGGRSDWVESRQWWALAAAVGVLAWAVAGFRRAPRIAAALLLLGATTVELRQARPGAEYHEMVPNIVYNDPGPVLRRLGREGGRYVSIAWDLPGSAAERAQIDIPEGFTAKMGAYYRISWPRRLAGRPAWEYAADAETISGRDGGLMPLRVYQEFFSSAVNPEGRLTAGVTLQAPSQWSWPALDLLGVRWFITTALPATEIDVLRRHGFRQVDQVAYFRLWERAPPPLARMQYDVDVLPSPEDRVARLEDGYPLLERAIAEEPVGTLRRPAEPPTVDVVERGRTQVRVWTETATDGLLVLADPWYPQWRVEVDGKPAELLRVDHAFRGVRVPAGRHEVVFTYQDRAMWLGAALTLVTCLALAGVWAFRRRRPARPGEPSSSPSSTSEVASRAP